MVNNNKHSKWTPEWEQKIKHFGQPIDKAFKKGEVKPDGTTVTADTETVKVNDFELLLSERKTLQQQKETKLEDITNQRGYKDEAKRIYKTYRELKEQVEEWKTNDYAAKYAAFLGTNSSGTKYRTSGWLKLVSDYNQQTWDKS